MRGTNTARHTGHDHDRRHVGDIATRELSERRAEISRRYSAMRRAGDPHANALLSEAIVLSAEFDAMWPVTGDLWSTLGPDRIIGFLGATPRYHQATKQYRAYWRSIAARADLPGLAVVMRPILLDLVDDGFSSELEIATGVASVIWNSEFEAELHDRAMASADPVQRSVIERFAWRAREMDREPRPHPISVASGSRHPEVAAAIDRLVSLWPAHDETRPFDRFLSGATTDDIDRLRESIAPHPLPAGIETWLRFSNGHQSVVWPGNQLAPNSGCLEIMDFPADVFFPEWSTDGGPPFIAIGNASHSWLLLELVPYREPAVLRIDVGGELTVVSPSVASLLHAASDAIEADWASRSLEQGPWSDDPIREDFERIVAERHASSGWRFAPSAPRCGIAPEDYPREWFSGV